MTNIEDRLNAAGERFRAVHAALSTVPEPVRVEPRNPLRRWAIPIVAAPIVIAAVLAIAFGLTALVGMGGSPTPPAKPTPTPVPSGKQLVSYHGIELLVPAGLPTTTIGCGPPQRSQILLANGISHGCMPIVSMTQRPGLTTVSISPLAPGAPTGGQIASVGGAGARIGYPQSLGSAQPSSGVTGFLLVPSVNVELDVTTPTKQQTAAILLSTRVVSVDQIGCRSQQTNLIPTENAPADELLPGRPVSGYSCQYQIGYGWPAFSGWLLRSQRLTPSVVAKLGPVINALPLRTRAGRQAPGFHDLITFGYADGSTRTIDAAVYAQSDPPIVTDGQHTATADRTLADLLPFYG